MQGLSDWFFKQQNRQEKFVSLYDMMFDGKQIPYLSFRLSLFSLQVFAYFGFHAIIFYFMSSHLATKTFTVIILASALKMMISSGFWGALETLRTEVRFFHHIKDPEEVGEIIGFWLTLSGLFSIPFFVLAGYFGWVSYDHYIHQERLFEPLFLMITLTSLAIHIPLEAYHSGIYGFSRIMRPRFSMVLGYGIALCILILAWPKFKIYAVLLSIIGESATTSFLNYYYTSYMYKLYSIPLKRGTRSDFLKRFSQIPKMNFILGGLANIFTISDSILILALYFLLGGNPYALLLIKTLYLISPLILASYEWAHLFYFDRKQLQNDQLALFISQYDKSIQRMAAVLGFSFGLFAVVASYLLISPVAALYTLTILPFFVMRSLIADQQIRAFSSYHYFDLIMSGVLIITSLSSIYFLKSSFLEKGIFITLAMIVIHAYLKRYRFPASYKEKFLNIYTSFYDFLAKLSQQQGLNKIYKLTLDKKTSATQVIRFVRSLSDELSLSGDQICFYSENILLFYETLTPSSFYRNDRFFAERGGGLISNVESNILGDSTKPFYSPYGACSIFTTLTSPLLKEFIAPIQSENNQRNIIEHFEEHFPEGIYYDPARHLGKEAIPLPLETVRKFTYLIWEYLYRGKEIKKSSVDLSVLFDDEQVRVIFVIPHRSSEEGLFRKIKNWQSFIHQENLRRSLKMTSKKRGFPLTS